MKSSIARVREVYPDIPLLFSIDSQDSGKCYNSDMSYIDIQEQHMWMSHQNSNEFNSAVGYNFEKFSPTGYENLVANAKRVYMEKPEYWNSLLTGKIEEFAEISRALSKPVIITECWGLIDYKDLEGLEWDWIRDLCELGVTTAAATGRWTGIATSNFCAPQFHGMWDDIEWHRRMTSIIKNSVIDDDLKK